MEGIDDKFSIYIALECRADNAGVAVTESGHCVEKVGRRAYARVNRSHGAVEIRVGMSH